MNFGNPTLLWSFLGLLIPIGIHLWNRKKLKLVKIGSVKLLEALPYRHSNSINLNEWALLAVRMLIVGLLSLIISDPSIDRSATKKSIIYVVEPSLANKDAIKAILDTITHGELRLLTKGFPVIEGVDDRVGVDQTPNYWQLAKEMEWLPSDSIVVLSNGIRKWAKGMRPLVKANINWMVLNSNNPVSGHVEARAKQDSVAIITAKGTEMHFSYKKETLAINNESIEINATKDSVRILRDSQIKQLPLQFETPIKILIVYNDSLINEMKYIKYAYRALSIFLDKEIIIQEVRESEARDTEGLNGLIWLSKSPFIPADIPLLVYRPDDMAKAMIEKGRTNNLYYLTEPLNSENILQKGLMESLLSILNLHGDLLEKSATYDIRGMGSRELVPNIADGEDNVAYYNTINLSPWLWSFLMGLLIGERILAKYRRQ